MSALRFPVTPVIIAPDSKTGTITAEGSSKIVTALSQIDHVLDEMQDAPLDQDALAEIRSVIEGTKALTRPQKRIIENPKSQGKATALARLEAEIANFDQKQRRAALVSVVGPQRIRGLAGSGKTVILAMKAAHLHLTRPDENPNKHFMPCSYRTFHQTSGDEVLSSLGNQYRGDKFRYMSSSSSSSFKGSTETLVNSPGLPSLSFSAAQSAAGRKDPFDYACRELVATGSVVPFYYQVLIDECQDFQADVTNFVMLSEKMKESIRT